MHIYIITDLVVHELKPPDRLSRAEFSHWFLNEVELSLLDPQFFLSLYDALFSVSGSGYVNSKNICHYASENPHEYLEELLHNFEMDIWSGMSCFHIISRFFFK